MILVIAYAGIDDLASSLTEVSRAAVDHAITDLCSFPARWWNKRRQTRLYRVVTKRLQSLQCGTEELGRSRETLYLNFVDLLPSRA